jgi:hypothetical protein
MNVVYRTVWTEYERGLDRPDGVSYAFDKEFLQREIRRIKNLGEPGCYSRASEIKMCVVTDELRKKIYDNGGIYTTLQYDDPGMLGPFVPSNPKFNLETFRNGLAQAAKAA